MTFAPIGTLTMAILFGSAMLAMATARFLPGQHLSVESKNAVSASMAGVGTLAALVLGLFLSTGNTSFQAKNHQVTQIATDIIGLDRPQRFARTGRASHRPQSTAIKQSDGDPA